MNVASKNKVDTFYSRGKLLLSGEYLVLKGAKALALPLKLGQKLEVEMSEETEGINWKSYMYDELWFEIKFDHNLEIIYTNKEDIGERLQKILRISKELNPDFLKTKTSFIVNSYSNFNFGWGIGSSSTLISNVAYWANIDAYVLNERVFGGSGFDIACSKNEHPFLYEWNSNERKIEPITFNPPFKSDLLFVYLGKKQNTQNSIKEFFKTASFAKEDIQQISNISEELIKVKNKKEFMRLLVKHENIISNVLNIKRIQDEKFDDFDGVLKSLGSWGGDFMLAVSDKPKDYIIDYFSTKGLHTFFSYDEIVL